MARFNDMNERAKASGTADCALARIASLAPITPEGQQALRSARYFERTLPARREIFAEGASISQPLLLLSGWACRARTLLDGRRQIVSLLLPGDLIGFYRQRDPVASTSIVALTDVGVCPAPSPEQGGVETGLSEAYATSAAFDEHYLVLQITRLGRLNAMERIADWFLELRERLKQAGLALDDSFYLPLTQEIIADTLGLTSVHVNRTLQTMRREGLIELRNGSVALLSVGRLATLANHRTARVSVR